MRRRHLALALGLLAARPSYGGDAADARLHWAFQPPVRPPVPEVSDPAWSRNPVDAFLAAAHAKQGLRASPPVDRDLWLRRVSLDLIGLPPTREELRAFRADAAPDAAERAVDRLLLSPRYGERWGRHWMDVWRYSDWFGLGKEVRFSHLHIWRWRDWIVDSLNSDKGYDRMILEMLAGDEIAPEDPEVLRATGFLARNWYVFNRNFLLDQVVEHTGRAFLGLTVQCARCHDHKFDPISQVDYYRLRAFFEPQHVRIDRLPGEPDRAAGGLTRAFDGFPDSPTYLFVRGDEARPEKANPLTPAVPAIFKAGPLEIRPVTLPVAAWCPDKQEFVIREALAAAERAVAEARSFLEGVWKEAAKAPVTVAAAAEADRLALAALAEARGKPTEAEKAGAAGAAAEGLVRARRAALEAPGDVRLAEGKVELAVARRAALGAVLRAEGLEDAGARESDSWKAAALEAFAAERRAALAEARSDLLSAERAVERAESALWGLALAADARKDDGVLRTALKKAAEAAADARSKLAAAGARLAAAEKAAAEPPSTAYTPRKLEYPRAATRYNETPPNDPYPHLSTGRRLALARWIGDRRNPLTARVAVNHLWTRHFGEPLSPSMFDFGRRTPRPMHAELLDWLAVEFMESGWSMKHLHRLLVLSEAYRMRSSGERADDPNRRIDPDNRYLWRMNDRRMEAEVIRDSLLYLSGKLDLKSGGPDLAVAAAEEGFRRSFYYRYARDDRIPLLTLFDAPSVEECYRRHETIVPQQALAMANSKLVLTRARDLAAAIAEETGPGEARADRAEFIVSAFERILSRPPTPAEEAQCEEALASFAVVFAGEKDPSPPAARARAALVHVLLNHHDFINIR